MDKIQRILGVAAVGALATSFAPSASARSTVAWEGAANPRTSADCFTESYGSVTNSECNSQQTWEVALPVDAAGAWNVYVNVTPGTGSASCQAYAVDQTGTLVSSSNGNAPTPASGSGNQTLTLAVPSLPGSGALYAACFLTQGATVTTLNWSQPQPSITVSVTEWQTGPELIINGSAFPVGGAPNTNGISITYYGIPGFGNVNADIGPGLVVSGAGTFYEDDTEFSGNGNGLSGVGRGWGEANCTPAQGDGTVTVVATDSLGNTAQTTVPALVWCANFQ